MCSMCSMRLCSPSSQISPSATSHGGLVGLVAGIVVVVLGGIAVVVVAGVVVEVVGTVVPFVVPSVVLGIMVVPMVVSGRGGHGHSEKEGVVGPQMQVGQGPIKSQLAHLYCWENNKKWWETLRVSSSLFGSCQGRWRSCTTHSARTCTRPGKGYRCLQQINIPPQFANSNTLNPLLLDIQQRLPHHLQCRWCWTHPRNRLLGSGGWDDQDHYEQDVVRWHLPSWKTLQSSWLIAELPSKRMEVERNINIAINLFLSIGWLSLWKERDFLCFEIRPWDDMAVALPNTSQCTYFSCRKPLSGSERQCPMCTFREIQTLQSIKCVGHFGCGNCLQDI